jgi:hypothetical protein
MWSHHLLSVDSLRSREDRTTLELLRGSKFNDKIPHGSYV